MSRNRIRSNNRRTIRRAFPRFLSLMVMSFLGVFVFAGLMATAPDMIGTLDDMLDAGYVYDIRIISTLGLEEADMEAIRQVESVEEVEGIYSQDMIASWEGDDCVISVTGLPEELNRITLLTGRLPERAGEIAVEANMLTKKELALGDTLYLDSEDLQQQEVTIVGTVESPLYYNCATIGQSRGNTSIGSGTISFYTYVSADSFDLDYYTGICLTVTDAAGRITSEEDYIALVDQVIDGLENIQPEREEARYRSLYEKAEKEIDDAEAEADSELADARAELEEAEQKLADGKTELTDGRAELDDAKEQLSQAQKTLTDSKKQLSEAKAELSNAKEELDAGKEQLTAGNTQLSEAADQLEEGRQQLEAAGAQLTEAEDQLTSNKEKLDAAAKELEEQEAVWQQALSANGLSEESLGTAIESAEAGLKQLEEGSSQLEAGIKELDANIEELGSGITELTSNIKQLESGITELTSNIKQLESGITERNTEIEALEAEESEIPADLQEEKAALNAQLSELRQKKEALEAQLTALQQQKESLDPQLTALQQQKESLAPQLTALQQQKESLVSQLTALQQQKDTLSAQLAGLLQLEEAGRQLAAGRNQYEAGLAEYESGLAEYQNGMETYLQSKAEYEAGQEAYEASQAKLEAAQDSYDKGVGSYRSGKKTYEAGLTEYQKGLAEYEEAKADYEEGEATYADSLAEYEDGLADYQDGLAEYEEAKADAESEIADARAKLADLETATWYIYDRTGYSTYTDYIDDSNSIRNLGKIFPVVFFAVAVLVSLISMNRMVEEDRLEIGTLKSLGFSDTTIMSKYLYFSLLATVAGGTLGAAGGLVIIPKMIFGIYQILFTLPPLKLTLQPAYTLLGFFLTVLCVCGSSLWTAHQVLKEKPSQLMRPKAPKNGRRILLERLTWLWSHMTFSQKVTARNIFRYKKRVLVTIGGIAGCTALILTGFGIKDSIVDIPSAQYYEIYQFDGTVYVSDVETADDSSATGKDITDSSTATGKDTTGTSATTGEDADTLTLSFFTDQPQITSAVYAQRLTAELEGIDGYLAIVENEEDLLQIADFSDDETGEHLTLTDGGVIINEKLATTKKLQVGDTLTAIDVDNNSYTLTIAGITRNYIEHFAWMTRATFEELGGDFSPNLVYFHTTELTEEEKDNLAETLLEHEQVLNISYRSTLIENVDNSLQSLNQVVLILIVLAAMLAFVVLYNLANININERRREIATLKVLGFYDREVDSYITKETFLLTLIGIALGLSAGIVLCHMVVVTIEVEKCRFINEIKPMSFLYSAAMSAAFTVIVNIITHFNLKRIDMTGSLKSVE